MSITGLSVALYALGESWRPSVPSRVASPSSCDMSICAPIASVGRPASPPFPTHPPNPPPASPPFPSHPPNPPLASPPFPSHPPPPATPPPTPAPIAPPTPYVDYYYTYDVMDYAGCYYTPLEPCTCRDEGSGIAYTPACRTPKYANGNRDGECFCTGNLQQDRMVEAQNVSLLGMNTTSHSVLTVCYRMYPCASLF